MSLSDMEWTKQHVISINDFSRAEIDYVLSKARLMEGLLEEGETQHLLCKKILGTCFFEPSTRTRLSFESAMKRLGGQSLGFASNEGTSTVKGETIADTIRMVSAYSDVIVIRHVIEGAARLAADVAGIPVLNGGDGANQHPTQTLLDLYTIQKEFGDLEKLKIAMVGDLKYGRTVHSLSCALKNYNVKLKFIAPENLRMPDYIKQSLKKKKIKFEETDKLNIDDCEVIYSTRIQKERFPDLQEYERVKDAFVLDAETVENIKKKSIILHPLPRVKEINPEIDNIPQARYFSQAANGVPVRMTLLCLVMGRRFW